MTTRPVITVDELMGLVAGTLNNADFERVAKAVKSDVALQTQLAGLEKIRTGLIHFMDLEHSPIAVEAFAENMLQRVDATSAVKEKNTFTRIWMSRLTRLANFFSASHPSVRLAYSLVAVQAIGIAWLVTAGIQNNDWSTGSMRSAGPASKQLGTVPDSVMFSVSFDPSTPEASIRGLLLELEAQIVAGPSRLGQYRIVVARNRSQLALLKLRESAFVEQAIEIAKEADKPDAKAGDKN